MSKSSKTHDPVLITFPPSLDSELGRFLLQYYGIQHREQRHTFIFSFFSTLWHGQTVVFPLLYGDSLKLVGPRAMSVYFDQHGEPNLRLWPQEDNQKLQVEKDWALFNGELAFATARFAYYHLLPHRKMMIRPLTLGAPDYERKSVELAYPLFAGLLRLLLGLSAQTAEESLGKIKEIFDAVDARLSSGRKYLVGDQLTLSDIAFAVATAPVVLPSGYGGPMPAFDQMPPAVQSVVTEMRPRPSAVFALRIYDEWRSANS